jgi:hypothetical protein
MAHILISGAHAMYSAPLMLDLGGLASDAIPLRTYLRVYFESSSAVPLFIMSIGSGLPVWMLTAAYAGIYFLSPAANAAVCAAIAPLPGQELVAVVPARALQFLANLGSAFFATAPVHIVVPVILPCPAVMSSIQV